MPDQKRTKAQRDYDMNLAFELQVQGFKYRDIAFEISRQRPYSISHVQVFQDLAKLRAGWIKKAHAMRDHWVAEEIARLALYEAEAWAGWLRSIGETVKTVKGDHATGEVDYTETKILAGDKGFLDIMIKIHEQRCKLLGLHAPVKVTETNLQGTGAPVKEIRHTFVTPGVTPPLQVTGESEDA